ncbi:hypothetical protein KA082_00950 [Candidatus Woesebacteria bacterium]|nr:hypothetical protein [Candidatus Woesebacteria bacterium]
MKVFFGISLRFYDELHNEYKRIYDLVEKNGFTNLNDLPVTKDHEGFYTQTEEDLKNSYIDLMKKLREADIVIIEATHHSLTMGYFLKCALDLDKPAIVLYKEGHKPYFFSAIQNDQFQMIEYTYEELPSIMKMTLSYAKENCSTRFNLFISAEIQDYLAWATRKTGMQKANFIRNLILTHKKEHLGEYLEDLKK